MSGSYRIVRICALLPAIYGLIAARSLTRPDSAKVQADLAKAEEAAGTMWTSEERFFCGRPKGNRADDPILEAASLFDNLYVMGRRDTAVYALKTEAGILLIDSGYQADVESVLLDGMKKLGLDSAQVKRVVITHGHGDHFGGALYLQEHFGAQVYLSEAEWNLMEHPVAGRGDGKAPQAPPPATPKHAMVMKDGQPIVLGGLKITPVSIPGHTPGSMGLIFPVHDNGTMHMAGFRWNYAGGRAGSLHGSVGDISGIHCPSRDRDTESTGGCGTSKSPTVR